MDHRIWNDFGTKFTDMLGRYDENTKVFVAEFIGAAVAGLIGGIILYLFF